MRLNPYEELFAAIEAERAAWLAVRDRLPGASDFEPTLWEAWREAIRRCDEARQAVARHAASTRPVR